MGRSVRELTKSNQSGPIALRTLIRLRWIALAAQLLTIFIATVLWDAQLKLLPLLSILVCLALSNLFLGRKLPANQSHLAGGVVLFDVFLLTGILALTGGPANPFSLLYLVQVMLAAILSSRGWTWAAVLSSSAGFALLFAVSIPLPPELGGHGHHMGGGSYSKHLQGMWLAYTIAAVAIGIFVSSLAQALRQERERQQQNSRLLGLAALAAGAAHEIGNPLGTIRIAASELELDLSRSGSNPEQLRDIQLINQEVERAKAVLESLAASAGELKGEAIVPIEAPALVQMLRDRMGTKGQGVEISFENKDKLPPLRWPLEAVTQAIQQLLRNALQASTSEAPVVCQISSLRNGLLFTISDQGQGMDGETLKRIGEPFFTTREGEGMGLGVFIARSLIERMGGALSFESKVGKGTQVKAWLPANLTKN